MSLNVQAKMVKHQVVIVKSEILTTDIRPSHLKAGIIGLCSHVIIKEVTQAQC